MQNECDSSLYSNPRRERPVCQALKHALYGIVFACAAIPARADDVLKTYQVTIPIAGHLVVTVQAADPDEAITNAFEAQPTLSDLHDWKVMQHVYAIWPSYPLPADATAEEHTQ